MPPTSVEYECLYVHVPFCAGKCGYCTFYSESASTAAQRAAYLARLDCELAEAHPQLRNLSAILIGGGTPNFLTPGELRRLLQILQTHCPARPSVELTVECNPEFLTSVKLAAMAEAGVNRVSLGLQSFSENTRRQLGRTGSLEQIEQRRQELREHSIVNLAVDLICGVPGQTIEDWRADLTAALALAPTHVSTYELSIEEGSALARRHRAAPPASELAAAFWREAGKLCKNHGLSRYEISNFARAGFVCRHHDAVWHGAPYLGCGPAACSFDGKIRWTNPPSLDQWLRRQAPSIDAIPAPERAAEILAFGLRTRRGWTAAEFKRRSGFDPWLLRGPQLTALCEEKLLAHQGGKIRPTAKGLLFADHVVSRLLA